MKDSLLEKLENLVYRHKDLGGLLSDPEVVNDQQRYLKLVQEYAQLEPVVKEFKTYLEIEESIASTSALLDESDASLRELAQEELQQLKADKKVAESNLKVFLLPKDERDDCNVFLEVRAGTGGDEAALFAGDLLRMYVKYAGIRGWAVQWVSMSESEQGGYKEAVLEISGGGVYSQLKLESGAHRVQRVPTTESSGRIHTSACTVAVMAKQEEIDSIEINSSDLRIDTFRASGAGGQHVNKTDSAIRITHLPTGVVVECQDERSQHKNKARAMSLLSSRLLDAEQSRQKKERSQQRKSLVGSGDRSERIRTYNFPERRVTDHRIGLTVYKLDEILQGEIDCVIQPLLQELQAEQLAEISDQ
jgi:peptide chain release factor 1